MTEHFTTVNGRHVVKKNIYVKADGKTWCEREDKEVAELKYSAGTSLTEAQKDALIFPSRGSEPVPDADARSAETIPDAERRRSKRK